MHVYNIMYNGIIALAVIITSCFRSDSLLGYFYKSCCIFHLYIFSFLSQVFLSEIIYPNCCFKYNSLLLLVLVLAVTRVRACECVEFTGVKKDFLNSPFPILKVEHFFCHVSAMLAGSKLLPDILHLSLHGQRSPTTF